MFMFQLLLHDSKSSESLSKLLTKKQTYTSPEVQNELLELMGRSITRGLAAEINDAKFFSILIDETTDSSNKEQMVLCLR